MFSAIPQVTYQKILILLSIMEFITIILQLGFTIPIITFYYSNQAIEINYLISA